MNRAQKYELIQALEACLYLQNRHNRDTIVDDLPFNVNIRRDEAVRTDITHIVTACLSYNDGLKELLECLQFYEGNSLAMQKVHTLIHIAKESLNQDVAPIKPTPPKPSPPEILTPTLSGSLTPHTEIVYIGDEVTWTLELHNNGPLDLYDLIISRNRAILADEFDLLMGKHYSITFKDSYQTESEATEIIILKASTNHSKRLSEKITATIQIQKQERLPTNGNIFSFQSFTPRLPIYFLLDTSGSMAGAPIEAVNQKLISFVKQLKGHPVSIDTAYISIITFGNEAKVVVPLTEVTEFQPPKLQPGGVSSLGKALRLLDEALDKEVIPNTSECKGDYQALVILIIGSQPIDSWQIANETLKFRTTSKPKIIAMARGQDIDWDVLKKIADVVVKMEDVTADMMAPYFRWFDQDEFPKI